MRRGQAGDDSVWWANTMSMFKAYRKDIELVSHGGSADSQSVLWCRGNGVVRVEVELKRRFLDRVGMRDLVDITQDGLEALFREQTSLLRRVDRSDEPDILAALPARYRVTAAAWLGGQDLSGLVSASTLYRHGKALRGYGIDIFQPRNVCNFPVKVRVVELVPLGVPEWYSLKVVNS